MTTGKVQRKSVSEEIKPTRMLGSSRFALTIVMLLGMAVFYAMRADMSVAIICMVNHTALSEIKIENGLHNNGSIPANITEEVVNPKCLRQVAASSNSTASETTRSEDGPYVWDGVIQNHILGAFFFGYLVLQIPGGWLASSLGGRWVVFISMSALSGLTVLLPIVANSWIAVYAVRVLQGIASAAVCPAYQAMIAQWAPPLERSSISTAAYSGLQLGNMFAFPVSGLLCRYFSWQYVFYCWGGIGFIWVVLWFLFAYNTPEQHPRIEAAERRYITAALAVESGGKKSKQASMNLCEIPWLQFAKSAPVWACVLGHYATDWAAFTFLSQTPRYMKSVHLFDIASNSTITAIPYLGYFICIIATGPVADYMQKTSIGRLRTRRILAIIGYMVPTALLIVLGYLPCEYWQSALVVLVLIISLSGIQFATFPVSFFDVAPKYSGLLFGISNTLACTAGILTNAIAALVMSSNPTLAEWRIVFFITAGVSAFGCFIYCLFVQAEVQPWATEDTKKISKGEKDEIVPLRVTHISEGN